MTCPLSVELIDNKRLTAVKHNRSWFDMLFAMFFLNYAILANIVLCLLILTDLQEFLMVMHVQLTCCLLQIRTVTDILLRAHFDNINYLGINETLYDTVVLSTCILGYAGLQLAIGRCSLRSMTRRVLNKLERGLPIDEHLSALRAAPFELTMRATCWQREYTSSMVITIDTSL